MPVELTEYEPPKEKFDGEHKLLKRLTTDFPYYAEVNLKIVPKDGGKVPFVLNKAQRYIHETLEKQKKETGHVRALVVKARQQGCSTYIAGRYYWQVTKRYGVNAFILSHAADTTKKLFKMTTRYHRNCDDDLKQRTSAESTTYMDFAKLDSSYSVGTAGAQEVGRGGTIHYFHGCLGPDTLIVNGDTGNLVPIKDVGIGFPVVTHTGSPANVSFISSQEKPVNRVVLKTLTSMPFLSTDEHKFFTKDGWIELSDMNVGDCIGYPVREITDENNSLLIEDTKPIRPQNGGRWTTIPDSIPADYNTGRILGLFLAEGCIGYQNKYPHRSSSVMLSIHDRETSRTKEWLDCLSDYYKSYSIASRKDCKTTTVTVYSGAFASFVESVVGNKDEKHLPLNWWTMGKDFVQGLVHGYLSGDGHSGKTSRVISANSIRSAITIGMRDAIASLGYGWSSISHRPAGHWYGRNCKEIYTLKLYGDGVNILCEEIGWDACPTKIKTRVSTTKIENGYAWIPVVSIEDEGLSPVMDLEIDHEDHSFCTIYGGTANSEVAFWANTDMHFSGVMQSIPDGKLAKGSEIVLESTANGMVGKFYDMVKDAQAGEGEYIVIFTPWFWQDEYSTVAPVGWEVPDDDQDYQKVYDLTPDQMYWRANKTRALGSEWRFKQEYPATIEEAFQTSGDESFISPELTMQCRVPKPDLIDGDIRIGSCDPAWKGDRAGLGYRCGKRVKEILYYKDKNPTELGNICGDYIVENRLDVLFVDVIGIGAGVYSHLVDVLKFGDVVKPCHFGHGATDLDPEGMPKYLNHRAECWGRMKEDMEQGQYEIPNLDELAIDLQAPQYHYNNSKRVLQLEKKEDMRKRGVASPDGGDVIAMTYSEKINPHLRKRDKRATMIPDYDALGI